MSVAGLLVRVTDLRKLSRELREDPSDEPIKTLGLVSVLS